MAEMMTTDVRAIMDRSPFDVAAVADLREVLNRDPSRYRTLREAVANIKERETKRKRNEAGGPSPSGSRRGFAGPIQFGPRALEESRRPGDGVLFPRARLREPAAIRPGGRRLCPGGQAGVRRQERRAAPRRRLRRAGQTEEAKKILAGLEKLSGSSGEYHFQQGCLLAAAGELVAASAEFEKTLSLEKDHNGALFELAYINDLYGNDDLALEYYKRCTDRPPVPLAAWINLGILYEDEMRFRDAEQCYRHVLSHEPNHPRARLFFKDCQASKGMYYDEEAERGYTVLKQLHEIPVTDFELSVRSRNCLRKMNIRTLGDLTRTTEIALLSSKNFGETSLAEIKEMMQAKGLRLGMSLEGNERAGHDHRIEQPQEVPPELQAILNKPIGDLNLSVRARKCVSKLNIQTVGDLLKHTGDELLECKNFGVTSLNEVREKLTTLSLKLKND